MHYTVTAYTRRKFQLHSLLERYFSADEVLEFRRLQFNTGMLISGSTALQFFNRTVYSEADLDLYVEHRLRKSVAIWLVHVGYTYVPHEESEFQTLEEALASEEEDIDRTGLNVAYSEQPHYQYGAGIVVLTFEKQKPYRKVQLITSLFNPLTKVLHFHSSECSYIHSSPSSTQNRLTTFYDAACVMNIITYNTAYSFFPRATFESPRRTLKVLPRGTGIAARKALVKYQERGWDVINHITRADFDGPNAAFWNGPRHVGDARCWTMRILPDIGLPDRLFEINAWSTQYSVDLQLRMSFWSVYSSTFLTTAYILPPDDALLAEAGETLQDEIDHCTPEINR